MNEFFREPKKNPFLIANRLLKKGADPGPKVPAGILFIFFIIIRIRIRIQIQIRKRWKYIHRWNQRTINERRRLLLMHVTMNNSWWFNYWEEGDSLRTYNNNVHIHYDEHRRLKRRLSNTTVAPIDFETSEWYRKTWKCFWRVEFESSAFGES